MALAKETRSEPAPAMKGEPKPTAFFKWAGNVEVSDTFNEKGKREGQGPYEYEPFAFQVETEEARVYLRTNTPGLTTGTPRRNVEVEIAKYAGHWHVKVYNADFCDSVNTH